MTTPDKPLIGLGAIETRTLREVVYERLRKALMSGQVEPGRKLSSRKLAAELSTSDMPVRSALTRLEALHALEPLPNGSLTLPAMSRAKFADLMMSRRICEGAATELAAGRMGETGLRDLRRACRALTLAAEDRDIDEYLLRNYDFKFTIYRASGSPSLMFLIETLWLQVGPFLRQFGQSFNGNLNEILDIDYHEEALEALERGDGAAARAAICADILDGCKFLLENGRFID